MSAIKRVFLIAGWALFSFVFFAGICVSVDAFMQVIQAVCK